MPDLCIYLFGAPRVVLQGRNVAIDRRKALALLAYLALTNQPQRREGLITLLWPELDQDHARAALRSTLPVLTKLAPIEWLRVDRSTLAIQPEAVWIDVHEVNELLARVQAHTKPYDQPCADCLHLLQRVVSLYSSPFMAGFTLSACAEFELWQTAQQESLQRDIISALRRLALARGDRTANWSETAIGYAQRWLELEPLDEEAHRALMRLYAANGLRAEALRQYQKCVALIDSELATPPELATTQLAEQIKSGALVSAQSQQSHPPKFADILPPLPSLLIGREAALTDLRARLGVGGPRRSMTVVQGWPGVGKSTTIAILARDPDLATLFPDGVLWASLGEQPDLLSILTVWAETLGIPSYGQQRTVDEITRQLIATLRARRTLLIVDDIWQAEHMRYLNVGGQHCSIVVTTRLNEVAHQLAPGSRDIYRLGVLSEAAGIELLELLAPDAVAAHPAEAHQLVCDIEGLPLAIQVAGRLLNNEIRLGWGIDDLLSELQDGSRLLEESLPTNMLELRRETTPTIAALLKRSTDALDQTTLEQFVCLGLFAPKPATFDLAAMAAAWGIADPRPSARVLVNRGLLEPIGGGRFQMHALLVLHARTLLGAAP